jgi:hypothetical protein
LIYFGGIAKRKEQQYKKEIEDLTEEKYMEDLISQCYRNAEIAAKKYSLIQNSLACLFTASLPWMTSIYFLYTGGN